MDNHFHLVLRVPQMTPVSDAELLRRYHVLYPKPTRYQSARLDVIAAQLATNGPDAVEWRKRQLRPNNLPMTRLYAELRGHYQ